MNNVDELLERLSAGELSAAERAELDRLAAADPAVSRAVEAEMMIGETFAAAQRQPLSGASTPDPRLIELVRTGVPPTPSFFTPVVSLGLAGATAVGIVIGLLLAEPETVVTERTVTRHDTVVRAVPSPVPPVDTLGIAPRTLPNVAAPGASTRVDAPVGRPSRGSTGTPAPSSTDVDVKQRDDAAAASTKPRQVEAEPTTTRDNGSRRTDDDDPIIVDPEVRTTDTVRGKARIGK